MMRFLLLALLLFPSLASAQPATDLAGLERRYHLLEQHQTRLEARLGEQSKRIARLKSQRPGVRRDFQLKGALQENFKLANKLTELRQKLRALSQELEQRYDQLLSQEKDPQSRAKLQKLKQDLIDQRSQGPIRIVTEEHADPLDAPEDLEAKADLLQDSAEKLRRQLRQVQIQLSRLELRAKLQRHSQALEENPFFESSPRRTGYAKRANAESADRSPTGNSSQSEPPSVPAPNDKAAPIEGGNGTPAPDDRTDDPSNFDATSASEALTPELSAPGSVRPGEITSLPPSADSGQGAMIVSIQDVLDPAVLRELSASSGDSADLKARIKALRKAQQQLKQMSGKLKNRAHKLRSQAKALRHQR